MKGRYTVMQPQTVRATLLDQVFLILLIGGLCSLNATNVAASDIKVDSASDAVPDVVNMSSIEKYPMKASPSNPELRNLSGAKINLIITTKANQSAAPVVTKTMVVELYDNSAANDLLARLPLSYTISNYSGWDEKLLRMGRDKGLSMADYTGGDEPGIPEVGYYEPGNWIALYFGYIGYWSGKIPVGKIQATCDEIKHIKAGSTVHLEVSSN